MHDLRQQRRRSQHAERKLPCALKPHSLSLCEARYDLLRKPHLMLLHKQHVRTGHTRRARTRRTGQTNAVAHTPARPSNTTNLMIVAALKAPGLCVRKFRFSSSLVRRRSCLCHLDDPVLDRLAILSRLRKRQPHVHGLLAQQALCINAQSINSHHLCAVDLNSSVVFDHRNGGLAVISVHVTAHRR